MRKPHPRPGVVSQHMILVHAIIYYFSLLRSIDMYSIRTDCNGAMCIYSLIVMALEILQVSLTKNEDQGFVVMYYPFFFPFRNFLIKTKLSYYRITCICDYTAP